MSFYTIDTPGNRDEEVKKYQQLREYLRAKDSIEKTGKYERKKELLKTYKPLIKPLTEIKTKVETLPQDIGKMSGEEFQKALLALPQPQNIINLPPEALRPPEQIEEKEQLEIVELSTGDHAADSLIAQRIQNNKHKEFLTYDPEDGTFKIKNEPIKIKTDGVEFKDKKYKFSSDLIDLITNEGEIREDISPEAVEDYKSILKDGEMLHQITKDGKITTNKKLQGMPKWEKLGLINAYDEVRPRLLNKYKEQIKTLKLQKAQKSPKPSTSTSDGQGIKTTKNKTVFLSSNPDTLADRLTLLCASQKAGNTGVNNEIVDICDELIRMRAMTRQQKNKILKEYKP